jgi:hypothetical protein
VTPRRGPLTTGPSLALHHMAPTPPATATARSVTTTVRSATLGRFNSDLPVPTGAYDSAAHLSSAHRQDDSGFSPR